MPKTPRDFSQGLIYSIICKTDETLIYVGSTTNFTQRKNRHKTACNNEKHRDHNTPVYVMIRANGGWDSFDMKPVREFPCENNIQLVIEEERIRKDMHANLNTYRAFLSPEERKEQIKEWNKNNTAKIAEKNKKYYEANAAKLNEDKKKYYQENSAKIAENGKKYSEANKAKISERKKLYYQVNKQQIEERRKIKKEERKNAL